MRTLIFLLLMVSAFASVAVAQSRKDKIEVGVQSTSLTLFHPDFPFDETQVGIGGRVTYNFNRYIAAEAEINFFPQKQFVLSANGNAIQAQFGAKIGKRFKKFGLFGKLRPGFLSVGEVGSLLPGQAGPLTVSFKIERETFFTLDAGGVLELYPSRRTVVRFDAGDTVIRHRELFGLGDITNPGVQLLRPAKFNHNFQFTAGVSFRLGDFPDEEPNPKTAGGGQESAKRYEVGAQFTSLVVRPPDSTSSLTLPRRHAEPGFGGRFTFNLTEGVAFEAEGNYYTRQLFRFPSGGHMFQGQFGGKVGKRFDKWGLFGKARPGFVGFSRAFEFPLGGVQVGAELPFVTRYHPSLDLGGVVEFYISPRWMARFDVGDTIIHYGEIRLVVPDFPPPITIQPSQTHHNLQVSSGIGFRF